MNPRTRQKLKLVSSLALAVLSLFSAVTLTFSWFSHNKDASGEGMDITIGRETGICRDYAFYRIDTTDEGAGVLFTETPRESASLGTYDALEKSYQCLLKIYVTDMVETLTVTASTDTAYFLGNPNKQYLLDSESNALSNVVGFKVLSPGDLTVESTVDGGAAYRVPSLNESDMQTFIDKNDISETTAPQNFTITVDAASLQDGETAPDGTPCRAAYLLISYDPALISAVFSANIGNPKIDNAKSVPFDCDFRLTLSAVVNAG